MKLPVLANVIKFKWQYLIVLLAGVAIGVFLENNWPAKSAGAILVTMTNRGSSFQVLTNASTVASLLADQGLSPASIIFDPAPQEILTSGMEIRYRLPLDVEISDGGKASHVSSLAENVGELFTEQGITLSAHDQVSLDLRSAIYQGLAVFITRITQAEELRTEAVNFATEVRGDPETLYGHETVVREGEAGAKEAKYLVRYKNGAEVSRQLLSSRIIRQPVAKIIASGRKIVVEAYENGRASWYAYKKCLCAAHPYFPRGSYLRVTNVASGKSLIVIVNDHGPDQSVFANRIIDLDAEAFKRLAPLAAGTIDIMVEKLKTE